MAQLRKFLLIGLGGSGGKTLRLLRDDVGRRLHQLGYAGGIPSGWQMLWFDVPSAPEESDVGVAPFPPTDYHGLVSHNVSYQAVHNTLMAQGDLVRGGLANWQPSPPSSVDVPLSTGAGQFRAIGRIVSLRSMAGVAARIRRAVGELDSKETTTELEAIARLLPGASDGSDDKDQDTGARPQQADPIAVVISSIAGGTGAGALMDVCDLLRETTGAGSWGGDSIGILYAPDVFGDLSAISTGGVQPNALATLSEVMAGYWSEENPGIYESALFAAASAGGLTAMRRGPARPLLIGSSNGEVRFGSHNDVFQAIGRALGSWVMSPAVQEQMQNIIIGANYIQRAIAVESKSGILPQGKPTPFSSAGYASVDLGRDRFAIYATERLASGAVDRLLRQHEEGKKIPLEMTSAEALTKAVDAFFGEFHERSGLDELGEKKNQLLDALRPEDRKKRLAAYRDQILEGATAGIAEDTPENWGERIALEKEGVTDRFLREEREALDRSVQAWVESFQVDYVKYVGETVARLGVPTVVRFLEKVASVLSEVAGELPAEARVFMGYRSRYRENISAALQPSVGKLNANNPKVRKAAEEATNALYWRAEAELRDAAALIAADVSDGLILPLRETLERASGKLRGQEEPGQMGTTTYWARAEGPPPLRLEPSLNEFLLTPVAQFPDEFERLIPLSVGEKKPRDAEITAITEIILGEGDGFFIGSLGEWIPKNRDYRTNPDKAPAQAEFDVKILSADLLDRARKWVDSRERAVGAYVYEGLRDYLADSKDIPPQEQRRRQLLYADSLSSAMQTSRPLIDVDNGILQRLYPTLEPGFARIMSNLPFPRNHPARKVSQEILELNGVSNVSKRFSDSRELKRIEVTTFLSSPYELPVFKSVVDPISRQWQMRVAAGSTGVFWQWRRTRHLPDFVPLLSSVRIAMVKGWYTGRILEHIDIEEDSSPVRITIKVPGSPRNAEFPCPMLTSDPPPWDHIAAVLESLPLAMVLFGDASNAASNAALDGYKRLLDLASDLELKRWIKAGVGSFGSGNGSLDTFEERKEYVLARIARFRTMYREDAFAEPEIEDTDVGIRRPMAWEIQSDITAAFDALENTALGVVSSEDQKGY